MDPRDRALQDKADTEREQADSGVVPFAKVIREHRDGSLHADLSDALAEIVRGVVDQGKNGTLTLKLRIGPGPAPGTIVLSPDVKADVPTEPMEAALFFHDDSGNLSRRDPRQLSIDDGLTAIRGGASSAEASRSAAGGDA